MVNKETIVLLHGWGGSKKSLQALAEQLSKDFPVLDLELPGFGETKQPKSVWGVKDYAAWVVETVKREGVEKFHLFGHSFGGQIAAEVAILYPQTVKSLILCAAAVIRRRSTLTKLKIKTAKIIKDTPLSPFLSLLTKNSDYTKASVKMRKVMNKILSEDLIDDLSTIKIPTLILWGDKDSYTPLSQAYTIHQAIIHSKLKIFKEAKHNLPLVKPKLVAQEVKKWILS